MPIDSTSIEPQLVDLKQETEMLEAQLCEVYSKIQFAPSPLPTEALYKTEVQETTFDVLQHVQEKVQSFLRIRSEDFVSSVFLKYADADSHLVKTDKLPAALKEFNIILTAEEAKAIMTSMNIDNNRGLDFKEFKRATNQPQTQVLAGYKA